MAQVHRLVILDDDPDWVEFMMYQCEHLGFECFGFTSIEALSKQLKTLAPDLILMTEEYSTTTGKIFIDHMHEDVEKGEYLPPILTWDEEGDYSNLMQFAFDCGLTSLEENHILSMKHMLEDILPVDDGVQLDPQISLTSG